MHEAAISEALLDQLASLASRHGWQAIDAVNVRIGLLSGVVSEALEFAFEALSTGTPAAGAKLVIENEPGRFACETCGERLLDRLDFTCPDCGGALTLIHAGRDILLTGVHTPAEPSPTPIPHV
jgi:hydrogenase nickel incorporation protein HypA/HybF